jgi:hypothetical protein
MAKSKFTKSELETIEMLINKEVLAVEALDKRFSNTKGLDCIVIHLNNVLEKVRKM